MLISILIHYMYFVNFYFDLLKILNTECFLKYKKS